MRVFRRDGTVKNMPRSRVACDSVTGMRERFELGVTGLMSVDCWNTGGIALQVVVLIYYRNGHEIKKVGKERKEE